MQEIQALVLAAGKGTRLKAKNLPKVLYPICGRPMIDYLINTLHKTGFPQPVVVIGFQGEKVQNFLGQRAQYVWQRKRLGTAHAVLKAKPALSGVQRVLIVLGDMPFWQEKTFKELIASHKKLGATLSLVSVILQNPSFFQYGRIVRDKNGKILKIVEEKEASESEKTIQECNPSCYLIETQWLWRNLSKIKKSPSSEYYLTDILEMAVRQKEKINVLTIKDEFQAFGINTLEHLKMAEKLFSTRKQV